MTLTRTASTSAQALAMELGITDTAKKAKAYDLILALLTLERERDKWEPIETAQHGSELILYFPAAKWLPAMIKVDRYPVCYPRKPTHWQPLPSPPGASE